MITRPLIGIIPNNSFKYSLMLRLNPLTGRGSVL